jgi:DNA-binding NtrC family response regulator
MLQIVIGSYSYAGDGSSRIKSRPLHQRSSSEGPLEDDPKILVVDDEELITKTLREILRRAGFHVEIASDGWSALEVVPAFRPHYLLTDVLMPGMNGVDLAIAVRKIFPETRIILFSGQAGISEILLNGRRQGFHFELIPKPMHPLKLIELLKQR